MVDMTKNELEIGDYVVTLVSKAQHTSERQGMPLKVIESQHNNNIFDFTVLSSTALHPWGLSYFEENKQWRRALPHEIPWFKVFYG